MRLLGFGDSKRLRLAAAAAAAILPVASFLPFHSAGAQSLYDVVGRNLKNSVKSVDRALSDVVGANKANPAKRQKSRAAQRADAIPPLPIRQPKPWHKTIDQPAARQPAGAASTAAARPNPPMTLNQSAASRVQAGAAQQTVSPPLPATSRNASPPASPPNELLSDKSWPVTVEEAKAKAKAKADEAAGKPADMWPDLEVNIAKARCTHLLKQVNAVVEFEAPFKKGPCGDPAPVRLISLGSNPKVAVSPPALVNCNMVFSLHEWLQKDLQPLAQKHLGGKITTLENMSSYSCRNAYARTSTRLSEHARANALDIRGFRTAKGNVAHLLAHWGPTERDIEAYKVAQREEAERRAAEAKADAKAKALAEARQKALAKTGGAARGASATSANSGTSADGSLSASRPGDSGVRGSIVEGIPVPVRALGYQPDRLGGPKTSRKQVSPKSQDGVRTKKARAVPVVDEAKTRTAKAVFLREAHKSACRIFGTVLGPEANNAHRNHFHVDLAPRKRSNFCE